MTDKTALVVHGFLKLTDSEKKEVIDELKKYYDIDSQKKIEMGAAYRVKRAGVILGPTSGTCPCCGR
jgi:uncharacterized protein YihD (DUF1040 family)